MDPKDRVGQKVSAVTMNMVPVSRTTNSTPCVGMVPTATGTCLLRARFPARASAGTITRKDRSTFQAPGFGKKRRVGVQTGHGAPIRPHSTCVGVENLAQPVRTGVAQIGHRVDWRVPIGVRPKVERNVAQEISKLAAAAANSASITILIFLASMRLRRYSGDRPTIRPR